jgi:hypothetical protein
MSWSFIMFSQLKWEVIVGFVDIGRIVDHHYWNCLFIITKQIQDSIYPLYWVVLSMQQIRAPFFSFYFANMLWTVNVLSVCFYFHLYVLEIDWLYGMHNWYQKYIKSCSFVFHYKTPDKHQTVKIMIPSQAVFVPTLNTLCLVEKQHIPVV